MVRGLGTFVVCCMLAGSLAAQPIVDGTRDASYGAPLAVQTVDTQFSDGNPLGGSELDAAYAVVAGGRLYLLLTGNLEGNYNAVEVFIDSRAGGENVLSGTPFYDLFSQANASQKFNGMTFDVGFTADYHLVSHWGGNGTPLSTHFVERQGGVAASVPGSLVASANAAGNAASGTIPAGNVGPSASGTALTQNLLFAFNGNNVGGVVAGTGAANAAAAAAVTTGIEYSIALADLGSPPPGSTIRIFAAINGSNHDYLSNQVLGGLPVGTSNLGGDGAGGYTGALAGIDFTSFAGTQYFSLQLAPGEAVPALSGLSAALLALALASAACIALLRRAA